MAEKMGKMGYDINNVTEKQVQGLLDYAQAIDNQRLKNIERKFFDPSGKMKKEGQDIVKKGLEGLGKKKDPFMGWTPKVVPKETVTASPDRIRKGFSTQMKLNRPEENQALIKSFMRRENAEFNALSREQQKEIFDMFDAYMKPKPDMASGGIAGELHLYDGGRARFDKGGKFNPGRRKILKPQALVLEHCRCFLLSVNFSKQQNLQSRQQLLQLKSLQEEPMAFQIMLSI